MITKAEDFESQIDNEIIPQSVSIPADKLEELLYNHDKENIMDVVIDSAKYSTAVELLLKYLRSSVESKNKLSAQDEEQIFEYLRLICHYFIIKQNNSK